jgi:hypothetical protein
LTLTLSGKKRKIGNVSFRGHILAIRLHRYYMLFHLVLLFKKMKKKITTIFEIVENVICTLFTL